MFPIYLFVVLLQTQGRSSPPVRPCTTTTAPHQTVHITAKTDQQTAQLRLQITTDIFSSASSWELPFLRANPLSVLPCRWSHSYCHRSDVRLCGPGRHCALHRQDDTVREDNSVSPPLSVTVAARSGSAWSRSHCACPVSRQIFHSAPPWDSCGKQVVYLLPMLTRLHGRRPAALLLWPVWAPPPQ